MLTLIRSLHMFVVYSSLCYFSYVCVLAGPVGAVSSATGCHSGGLEFVPRLGHITFVETGRGINFDDHSVPIADSVRAVVSYWRKNVHLTLVTCNRKTAIHSEIL